MLCCRKSPWPRRGVREEGVVGSGPGHIELERALDSIRVGRRHRDDLGDLDQLTESIERDGMLQPITITPDGVLVCGLRRLTAMRRLGWKTANVWVRSGITDRLGELLAEQDDNALHKPLTLTEQATLYRELKQVMAEDAARRQEATRFGAADFVGDPGAVHGAASGGATVAPPSEATGKSRAQAAKMVSGKQSYTSFERINELQRLAADETQPASVRERAAAELEGIDAGGSITAAHQRAHAEASLAQLERIAGDPTRPADVRAQASQDAEQLRAADAEVRAAELEQLAAEALARLTREQKTKKGKKRPAAPVPMRTAVMSVRAFVLTWEDLAGWWERADPEVIGPELTPEQWELFTQTVAGTVQFMHAATEARDAIADDPGDEPARLQAV
ncbi:MAG: ParB N-terminal domain-containing protein [Actinobacteria bacterium]|nr:ParB N-terminal domain-containing protein [Actinomycetota bacterium]